MTDGNRTWCAFLVGAFVLAFASGTSWADGSADNTADSVRRIPKIGVEVSDADRAELTAGLAALHTSIEQLRQSKSPLATELLPDVLIFHRAVDQALRYREFFEPKEVTIGKALLKAGQERADQLLAGEAPWTKQTGRVVRGYISKIDRTVQPIGLLIPASYKLDGGQKHRLDFWFHGRGETLSELDFIFGRHRSAGEFTPPNAFVLHSYGRYCNGNKFAGETDVFEALAHVKKYYPIDENRLVVRGFSLGGAACWQFAVHYPGKWAAAASPNRGSTSVVAEEALTSTLELEMALASRTDEAGTLERRARGARGEGA